MSQKVFYRDRDGLPLIGDLIELEIERYFDRDPVTGGRRNYGFAKIVGQPKTKAIFFHYNNGYQWMRPRAIKKLDFIVEFSEMRNHTHSPIQFPETGGRIVGVIGEGRKGLEIVAWSYPSSYQEALALCDVYLEHEKERLERNPNFRCQQIERALGSKDRESTIYEGNKEQFEKRYPLGSFMAMAGRPDPLLSQQSGDVEFVRWFERETATGWERCGDPRKMRFQLTQKAARVMLRFDCTRDDNGNSYPIWRIRHSDEIVAIGSKPKSDQKVVSFHDTPGYLRTVFEGKVAEELWKIGDPLEEMDPISRNLATAAINARLDSHES